MLRTRKGGDKVVGETEGGRERELIKWVKMFRSGKGCRVGRVRSKGKCWIDEEEKFFWGVETVS